MNITEDDHLNILQIQANDIKWSINLKALKHEISFSSVVSCLKTKTSGKSIAVLLFAILLRMGPSVWDIGSDTIQRRLDP